MTLYPTILACKETIFPYIRRRMASNEPAPEYEFERRGLDRLDTILHLMQRDDYQGPLAKAAYLFCSIIDGHHFSNGNKRLAVATIIYFLLMNNFKIHAPNMRVVRDQLTKTFPNLQWEEATSFTEPHEYFFYHLALIIADRSQKGQMTFAEEQMAVKMLLEVVACREDLP